VRVRLLVDDLYAARSDFDLATLSAHPNIEVRVFNPFLTRGPPGLSRLFEFLGDRERLEHRMHNKLWIADNAVAIVGGRNLGDQYFAARAENNFADLDLFVAGPVVRNLSRSHRIFGRAQASKSTSRKRQARPIFTAGTVPAAARARRVTGCSRRVDAQPRMALA
jgi:phosphatidylserine/phosphatidylglycerophosphate/cardiolipin synthase-like enzyme